MDALIRIVSGLLLLLSVAALVLAILFVRRETRIVIRRDLLRLIIAAATVLVMNAVLDVATPGWLIAVAIVLGGGLGLLQGRQLTVRTDGAQTYAQRTVWGVAAWGAGTVLLQLAGVINRSGLANLGLAAGFFGAASVAGLLIGRGLAVSEARRSLTPSTAVLLVLALTAGTGFADNAQEHDIRDVFKGDVEGVTVQIRGTGIYYGDSVRLDIANTSGRTIRVRVPAGLKLVPGNSGAQTMITAGGEVIEVPPTPGTPQTDYIKAFCGEMQDDIPSASEVFTPGGLVDDQMLRTIERIQDGDFYDFTGQEAIWHLTDANDISGNELVRQLIAPATEIPAEDAIRLSLAGLTGTALLLANALVNAGHSVDDVLSAWRSGTLRDLVDGSVAPTSPSDGYVYRDPFEEANNHERVRSILEKLPPDQSRRDAEAGLLDRLRNEENQRALDRIREAIGPIAPDSDVSELLRDNRQVDQVLDQLPDDVRRTLLDRLHRTLEQERLRNAVDTGMTVLDQERRVEVLIDARNDQNQPWRFDEMLKQTDDATLDAAGDRLDEGATPTPTDQSVSLDNLTGEEDLLVAVRRNPTVREYLDSLPPDIRPQVEQQMLRTLEQQIQEHTVNRVREIIGPIGPDTDLERALRDERVVDILNRIPPNQTTPIDHHIRTVLEQERLRNAVDTGMTVLDQERRVEVLIDARNDQNQPWRFDEMLKQTDDATLDAAGDRLDEGATPTPTDQSVSLDNLTGEEDLLVAVRRNPTVREYLDSLPPDIRPQVEQQMVRTLEQQIQEHTVNRVREIIGPIGPDTDLERALRDDRVVDILNRIPPNQTTPIDHHIRTVLEQEQVKATVEAAHQGVDMNRAEQQLRTAVQEGRVKDAAQILEGVTPEQAEELSSRVDVPRAAQPKGPGLPPTQKPAPQAPQRGAPPSGPSGPPPTPLPPRD